MDITAEIKKVGKILPGIIVAICLFIVFWLAYHYVPRWIDWPTYRSAALALFAGRSPYDVLTFYNPPWVLILLIPLAVLPERIGGAILFILNLVAFTLLAYKYGANLKRLPIFILSLPVIFTLYSAQIDGILLLGLLLPRWLGLFLLLAKPQIGIGIAIIWFIEEYKANRIRGVIKTFAPVTIAYLLSLAIYRLDMVHGLFTLVAPWNTSLWPYSIPVGLALIGLAIYKKNSKLALISSPLLSPYVGFYSWSVVILGFVEFSPWVYLVSLISWLGFFLPLQ